jgi:protein-S-isoprenylcysteine O-methyltransferase Ste14
MRHVVYDLSAALTCACWGAIAVVWAVGALAAGRGEPVKRAGRDVWSAVGAGLAVSVMAVPVAVWRSLTAASPWLRLAGLPVLLGATAGTIAARLALGSLWSSAATTRRGHVLRTSGPYAVTRHPIYTGIAAMLLGSALAEGLGRWAALTVAVMLVLVGKAREEERLLSAEFPDEYERYRRRVPRLVPRLRRPA